MLKQANFISSAIIIDLKWCLTLLEHLNDDGEKGNFKIKFMRSQVQVDFPILILA